MKYAALIFLLFTFPPLSQAQMSAIGNGGNATINAFGVCQIVTNNTGATIMVPWNSAGEWSAFRSYKPPAVSLAGCCVAYAGTACTATGTYWAGTPVTNCFQQCGGRVASYVGGNDCNPACPGYQFGFQLGGWQCVTDIQCFYDYASTWSCAGTCP